MIPAFLAGPAVKWGGIGLLVVAIAAFGFKRGLEWREGQVAAAKAATAQALAEAGRQEERAAKAERDYNQLRREVADAMAAGQARAIELEKEHAERAERAKVEADGRVADVLGRTRRMLDAVAPSGPTVRAGSVPEGCRARQLDDPAVERALIGRVGECAAAEARLSALQSLVR